MAMNGFFEDMMYGGLFDNIEDLLDFSTDDEALGMGDSAVSAGGDSNSDGAAKVSSAVTTATTSFQTASDVTKICDEINIHEDWITNFLDDTNFDIDFSAATGALAAAAAAPPSSDCIGSGRDKEEDDDDHARFRSFSPVSVLDEPNNDINGGSSSSSSSSSSFSSSSSISSSRTHVGPTMMLVPARARSKRPRRAAAAPSHATVPIVPPASEGPLPVPTLLPECESFGESETCALLPPTKKKTKRRNHHHHQHQNFLAGVGEAAAVRKCQHCGIQKTPQWRAGPTGPKTLCNACGVRYKSGRLFPEYRPAASPTFVPSIHSNSHKKVVEMRIRACQQKAADGMPSPENPAAKNCDLLAYIRRKRE